MSFFCNLSLKYRVPMDGGFFLGQRLTTVYLILLLPIDLIRFLMSTQSERINRTTT